MARSRLRLSPIEWLALSALVLGLIYGVVTFTSARDQCVNPPGSLSIRHDGGERAVLQGTMAGQATCKLRALARVNPAVTTLVLVEIPGTVDLLDTQAATRFVRRQGWNTVVPATGLIASGGVMLFLGGVERQVSPGGQVGVHAWSQRGQGRLYSSPDDIPANAERAYRDIYRDLGIDPTFYDFQVQAAPAEDIHWMSRSELQRWGLLTTAGGLL